MKKNKYMNWKKLYYLICVCMAMLLFPVSSLAASEGEEMGLSIQYPIGNVVFTFYKVANFSETEVFDLIEPFDKYVDEIRGLDILEENPEALTTEMWIDLANTLSGYVISKPISYDFIQSTNDSGELTITNMERGLYLIIGDQTVQEEKTYTPAAVLVTVPNRDTDGAWDNHVVLDYTGKITVDDIYDEFTVQKIWDDEGYENKRTEEIIVNLYMDDNAEPYKSVVLNADNNWAYTWTNLPTGHQWTATEKVVPDDYEVKYQPDCNGMFITNYYSPDTPNPPSNERLPQTGQLWWPVPFLAIMGITLFAIGWVRRNSGE